MMCWCRGWRKPQLVSPCPFVASSVVVDEKAALTAAKKREVEARKAPGKLVSLLFGQRVLAKRKLAKEAQKEEKEEEGDDDEEEEEKEEKEVN